MASEFLCHVIEGKLLGIDSKPGGFASEFPIRQTAIYRIPCYLFASREWAGTKRENVYFLIRFSHIKGVD
jgi:hypothetical protein